jgi:hypothetical protein
MIPEERIGHMEQTVARLEVKVDRVERDLVLLVADVKELKTLIHHWALGLLGVIALDYVAQHLPRWMGH